MRHRVSPLLPLCLIVVVVAAAWAVWSFLRPDKSRDAAIEVAVLEQAVAAVALSENGRYREAMGSWEQLRSELPSEVDVQINQAVTLLKWLDEANGRLSGGIVRDAAQVESLKNDLEQAYQDADRLIERLSEVAQDDPRGAYLQAGLLEAKARQLTYPDDQELRKQAAKVLVQALDLDPAQPLLACRLDDIVQEIADEDAALNQANARTLLNAWRSQPRNFYLLVRSGEVLLKNQDPALAELLEPSLEMAAPMMTMLTSVLGRNDPQQIVSQAKEAILTGQWRQAQPLRLWFNVLKGTTAFRPDTRLVKPDMMALLDASFVTRLADKVLSKELPAAPEYPKYAWSVLNASAQAAVWYDFNVDLRFDVAVVSGKDLSVYRNDSETGLGSEPAAQFGLSFEPTGLLAVDLFEVDAPERPRVVTVAQLMEPASSDAAVVESNSTLDSATLGAGGNGAGIQPSAQGKRHDTLQELVVWSVDNIAILTPQLEGQSWSLASVDSVDGLAGLSGIQSMVDCDIDADGDLDLVVADASGLRVLQNSGNRRFQDVSRFSEPLKPEGPVSRLRTLDIDRDLDQDILVAVAGRTTPLIYENLLHSQFRIRELDGKQFQQLGDMRDVAVADLDGNASWDIFTIGESGIASTLTRTVGPGGWLPSSRWLESGLAGRVLEMADLNNDGHIDLTRGDAQGLIAHSTSGGGRLDARGTRLLEGDIQSAAALDCDGDGVLDWLIRNGQKISLGMGSLAESRAGFLSARVRGINDVNGGGRNNHYSIGSVLELHTDQGLQSRTITQPLTHFGLGASRPLDLRVIFTNGLTQHVIDPATNQLIEERQELKGSCPFVYGWRGGRFELITDLLWNAPLGLQVSRGQVIPDRRWEYLLLPGELVRPREGYYELRITEELWEVAYFDHVALTAIDHPEVSRVFTNEKVGPPDIAQPAIFEVTQPHYPQRAQDQRGRDILARLNQLDSRYVQAFDYQICQGFCEPHYIELDFNQIPTSQGARLYLNGWMHPTDTSLNIGLAQQKEGPEPPSLWAVDERGQWQCVKPFMGFPGGKPKSIVIDLANAFLCKDLRLRIASSQQIYWDEAFVAFDSPAGHLPQSLRIDSAELRYRGFGKLLPRAADQPHRYDYDEVSTAAKWPRLEGPFTRYGDVKELLQDDDDRTVVMVSGDEMVLRFRVPDEALPSGWTRDFVLHSVGWDKDADLNTLAGDGSLPMPFKGMKSYPPPVDQQAEADEVLQRNAAHLTRLTAGLPAESEL